jgi:muramoyltetrapeptide carboxypeptidase
VKNIKYQVHLKKGDTIAVTAPSSGVDEKLHHILYKAKENVEKLGYEVTFGSCLLEQRKCVSAPKEKRASELMSFLLNDEVKLIMPPWGGEFLMDILPLLDWDKLRNAPPKWILGYSDTSTLSFAYTINTGYASAHGTNFFDLSFPKWDDVTVKWEEVLSADDSETVIQKSSTLFQSSWENTFNKPGTGFDLDSKTEWKSLSGNKELFSGRLLGGCLDTIRHLVGTPYGNVPQFLNTYMKEDGVIWYLESCQMSAADIYRSLWQLKEAGWFQFIKGVMYGRPTGYSSSEDFTIEDAFQSIFDEYNIPVLYDVDIGHKPPQLTLINGAFATVEYEKGKGTVAIKRK